MAYDAKAVVNFFLSLAAAEGKPLTPMKVQKLVYYAHGWYLALTSEPLIDEQVEAWTYGPVIPSLYHALKHYGNGAITEPACDAEWECSGDLTFSWKVSTPTIPDAGPDAAFAKAFLNKVWEIYSPYSAIQLSNMTHTPGGPWDQVKSRHAGQIPKGTDIPPNIISDHFRRLMDKTPAPK